jgi:hypothetical protein
MKKHAGTTTQDRAGGRIHQHANHRDDNGDHLVVGDEPPGEAHPASPTSADQDDPGHGQLIAVDELSKDLSQGNGRDRALLAALGMSASPAPAPSSEN